MSSLTYEVFKVVPVREVVTSEKVVKEKVKVRAAFMPSQPPVLVSHWNHYIEGFEYSSQEFYRDVIREIDKHQVPGLRIRTATFATGGIFSPKRLYLRIKRKKLSFDICAAPFGNGFFFSYWFGKRVGLFRRILLAIPLFKRLDPMFDMSTYYTMDSEAMFQAVVKHCITKAVNGVSGKKGYRMLSEADTKPVMKNLFV